MMKIMRMAMMMTRRLRLIRMRSESLFFSSFLWKMFKLCSESFTVDKAVTERSGMISILSIRIGGNIDDVDNNTDDQMGMAALGVIFGFCELELTGRRT